jgi:hypothetical protein
MVISPLEDMRSVYLLNYTKIPYSHHIEMYLYHKASSGAGEVQKIPPSDRVMTVGIEFFGEYVR